MTAFAVAVLVIALSGILATGIMLFAHRRRDKRREAQEIAVAKAAHAYSSIPTGAEYTPPEEPWTSG